MRILPLLAAALLISPVHAAPAPTDEELASPLPPLSITDEDVQSMKNWTDALKAIADILRSGKTPDELAAELEQLTAQAQQAGEGMKQLRFWKRQPALRQLGMNGKALEELAEPMVACMKADYHGSKRLEAVMDTLADQLLTGPFRNEQGEADSTLLTPPQIVQEYLSIVHGVRVALAEGQSDAEKAAAMELLLARLLRLGDMISSDNIRAIRSELERRAEDIRRAQEAAGSLIQALGDDIAPELHQAMRKFGGEVASFEDQVMP